MINAVSSHPSASHLDSPLLSPSLSSFSPSPLLVSSSLFLPHLVNSYLFFLSSLSSLLLCLLFSLSSVRSHLSGLLFPLRTAVERAETIEDVESTVPMDTPKVAAELGTFRRLRTALGERSLGPKRKKHMEEANDSEKFESDLDDMSEEVDGDPAAAVEPPTTRQRRRD